MRDWRTHYLTILIKQLSVVYLSYSLCRIAFYFFNRSDFHELNFSGLLSAHFFGLRFDSFSVFATNGLFILLSLIPLQIQYNRSYNKVKLIIFLLSNLPFYLLNIIDIGYFPFLRARSTSDLFKQIGGQTDVIALLPQFIRDYWYLLILFIVLSILNYVLYKRIEKDFSSSQNNIKLSFQNLLFSVFFSIITIIAIRGGLQRIPIDVVDAGKYTEQRNTALVLNSSLTLIKSFEKNELVPLDFGLSDITRNELAPTIHRFDSDTFARKNVVILILESFSKEYTGLGKHKSYTPFFDSLCSQSLCFENAFSNGHKSIEGVPAILSGIPSLMENPFINSTYACNQYQSIASILRNENYSTAFFHGGINGTMNFDSYAMQAGYEKYYGKDEYNNDDDFDGFWGIWDDKFLQYTSSKLSEMKQPFHAAIFTLSSHHPYQIPKNILKKFPKGDLDIHESIGYADYSLNLFFQTAKKQPWYKNTLFVLVADHCSISRHPYYSNQLGQFAIPIIFFSPDNSLKGSYSRVSQQIDIMPTTLEYLGYDKSFFCFGKPLKDTSNRAAVYYSNSFYQMVTDSFFYTISDYKIKNVFRYRNDSALTTAVSLTDPAIKKGELLFKAFIQTYNTSLINNACKLNKISVNSLFNS
ncbi:MAG: LTA synthase family protein [Bacteroidia bacterium]